MYITGILNVKQNAVDFNKIQKTYTKEWCTLDSLKLLFACVGLLQIQIHSGN